MADVAKPRSQHDAGGQQLPRTVSALRSSRSGPRRVSTHVSIVVPKPTAQTNPVPDPLPSDNPIAASSSSRRSHDLSVTSTPWAKKLILTLDGGGIKGYSSLIILRALMNEIAKIERTLEPCATSSAQTDRIPANEIPDEVLREGQYLPCHYFDYIAGTSVGGLIAIMLGMIGKSADECITEFHLQNKAIPLTNDLPGVTIDIPLLHRRATWPTKRTRSFFDTFAKFSAMSTGHTLAASQRESMAASTTVGQPASSSALSQSSSSTAATVEFKKDIFQCQTLAWCTQVKEGTHHRPKGIPYAFCSYKEEEEEEEEDRMEPSTPNTPAHIRTQTSTTTSSNNSLVSIPEVAKAITTPSSSSFKPFQLGSGQFVDGSKQIRDPTLEVLKELYSLLQSDDDGEDDDDELSPTTATRQSNGKKEEKAHNPPIDLILSLGTDEHHAWFYEKLRRPVLERAHSSWRARIDQQKGRSYREYHRLEVKDIRLGLRKKYYLAQIEEATEQYLAGNKEVREEIRQCAEFLVKRRRDRAKTSRWETFALGVKYFCHHYGREDEKGGGCNAVNPEFESRGDFYEHLEKRHGLLEMAGRQEFDIEAELDKGRRFGCS